MSKSPENLRLIVKLDLCRNIINSVNDKNHVDTEGHTPLHQAASYGHLPIICILIIENISDKNPANDDGGTPLHFTAIY